MMVCLLLSLAVGGRALAKVGRQQGPGDADVNDALVPSEGSQTPTIV